MDDTKIFEKNVQCMMKYKVYMLNMTEKLDQEPYKYKGIITDIFWDQDMNGNKILGVKQEGRDWYLNSRYDADAGVRMWIKNCKMHNYYGIVVVVGMANLNYIRELRKSVPDVRIIVYEPDKYIWNAVITTLDMEDLICDDKMIFMAGEIGKKYLEDVLSTSIDYSNYKYMQLMISPNYGKIYELESLQVRKMMFDRMEDVIVNRNTVLKFSGRIMKNRCVNFYDSLFQYNASSIQEVMKNIDFEKVPAIVVAAGPSLDKNIKELSRAKGKAFIIAVDAAIKPLLKADIVPDMTVTIDPKKWIKVLYEDERIKKIPVLVMFDANHDITVYQQGRRYYAYKPFDIAEKIWQDLGKEYMKIESGGSVANDAFSLVRQIGFKNIILVGQDLAYTGDKVHSDDSYGELRNNTATQTKTDLYIIKDIHGNQVYTDYAMDIFRRWIENQILLHSELEVIDATEGGAKIGGTKIMCLKDAIDIYCRFETKLDFVALLNATEESYTAEERQYAIDFLVRLYESMDHIKGKLQNAYRAYEKLAFLNLKRKYSGSDFEGTLKKIEEYNTWMTTAMEVKFLNDYAGKENYEVMENIYVEHGDETQQIKEIAEGGMKMVKAYTEATQKFKEDMAEIIELIQKERR